MRYVTTKLPGSRCHKHCYHQFFQCRLRICIAKLLLAKLPERNQKIIFPHFLKEFVVFQRSFCDQNTKYLLKRAAAGPADGGQKADKDIFLIEVLNFQIIETLRSLFTGKELDMLLDDRLIFFFNTEIHAQQGRAVGKETLGI